jgi:hypothetical protein
MIFFRPDIPLETHVDYWVSYCKHVSNDQVSSLLTTLDYMLALYK